MAKKNDPAVPGFQPIEVAPHVDETFRPIEVTPYEPVTAQAEPSGPAPTQSPDAGEEKEN